jgi:hypothetical protein
MTGTIFSSFLVFLSDVSLATTTSALRLDMFGLLQNCDERVARKFSEIGHAVHDLARQISRSASEGWTQSSRFWVRRTTGISRMRPGSRTLDLEIGIGRWDSDQSILGQKGGRNFWNENATGSALGQARSGSKLPVQTWPTDKTVIFPFTDFVHGCGLLNDPTTATRGMCGVFAIISVPCVNWIHDSMTSWE